jgi:hypothetical protein
MDSRKDNPKGQKGLGSPEARATTPDRCQVYCEEVR